jgi:hypothetical protein
MLSDISPRDIIVKILLIILGIAITVIITPITIINNLSTDSADIFICNSSGILFVLSNILSDMKPEKAQSKTPKIKKHAGMIMV